MKYKVLLHFIHFQSKTTTTIITPKCLCMSICVGGDVRVCVCAGETEEKKMKHKNGEN